MTKMTSDDTKYAVILTGGYDLPECFGPFTKDQAEDFVLSQVDGIDSQIVVLAQPAGYDYL